MGYKKSGSQNGTAFHYFIIFRAYAWNNLQVITTSDQQQPASCQLRYQ